MARAAFGRMTIPGAPPCPAPQTALKPPGLRLPAHACDSHLHILGPADRFPYAPDRVYTPPDCLLPAYRALQQSLGLSRCVLVQPSVYGTDNRVLLEALAELGDAARGVVVLEGDEPASRLADMHALGVRGVRVNLVDVKEPTPELPIAALQRLADRVAPLGWHLELLVHVDQYPGLDESLGRLDVPLVFGHLGYLSRQADTHHPGMRAMAALMKAGRAWAKMTGPYRIDDGPRYPKVRTIARWLAGECMERLVWGTDWPHVMVRNGMPHDADLLDAAGEWLPAQEQRQALFADNAARLYGWP